MMIRPGSINGTPGHFVHICYDDCPDNSAEGLNGFFSFITKALNPLAPIKQTIKAVTHPSIKNVLQTAPLANTKFGWQLEKTVGPIAAYFIPVVGPIVGPLASAGAAASRAKTLARDQANAIRDAQNRINQALRSGAPIDPVTGLPIAPDAGAQTPANVYPTGGGSDGSISDQISEAYNSLTPDTRKYLKYGAYALGAFVLYKFLKPNRSAPIRRRRHVSAK